LFFKNVLWYAWWNAFPATRGHVLVIPFRHLTGYFDTPIEEQATLPEMLLAYKKR